MTHDDFRGLTIQISMSYYNPGYWVCGPQERSFDAGKISGSTNELTRPPLYEFREALTKKKSKK